MPNWAMSNYSFYSKNKNTLKNFLDKLDQWITEETLCKDAWDGSSKWLGNILLHAGFKENDVIDGKHGRCRGEISELYNEIYETQYNGEPLYSFEMTTETAWCAMAKMWESIIDKLYPGKIKFCYISIEPMVDYAVKFDPDHIMDKLGYSKNLEYIFDKFIRVPEYMSLNDYDMEVSTQEVVNVLETFLHDKYTKEEIEKFLKDDELYKLLEEANAILKEKDEENFINIFPIDVLTENEE